VSLPKWDDPALKAGTMVRGALWLVAVVGEGEVFTKEQIRQAFPGISQADRRIRDLRDYRWVIHTNTDDASLAPGEQRLAQVGIPVWDSRARRAAEIRSISAKERQSALAADSFQCVICGIAGGEAYPEEPNKTAVLSVALRSIVMPDQTVAEQLVTQCKVCCAGINKSQHTDIGRLLSDIRDLEEVDQQRIHRWMRRGRRGPTPLDRAWAAFRCLPAESQGQLLGELGID
jgi:hypothetical protein